MFRFLLTCCALLISLLTANGQSFDLPHCSPEQLSVIGDLSPEISAIEADLGRIESMADVLRVNAEHLRLRQKLWDDLQLCDVYLEFTSLFSARFNDVFAASAMEGISPGQEESPRWKLVEGIDGEARNLILANLGEYVLAGLIPGSGDSQSEPLAACSETQRQYARGAKLKGYTEILNQAMAVDTVEDLLRYDAAHLEFRESAWADLPRCADAYEVALLMFRISGDFVVGHALAFLGVPRDSNPYVAQLMDDVSRLPAWMIPAALRDPDAVYALFESSLPGCSAAELLQLPYFDHSLLALAGAHDGSFMDGINRDNLRTYARVEIDWRNWQFVESPRCAEALALTLTLSELGSDMVAAQGFSLAGEPDLASRYREQALLGMDRFRSLQAAVIETDVTSGEFVNEETQLSGCTADQLLGLNERVFSTWQALANILRELGTRSDFASYAKAQFEWRRDLRQRLPPCAEAVELSLLLHQGVGIFAGLFALDFADIDQENNAYARASNEFAEEILPLLNQMQAKFTGAE
ncbi:MAG: hypothetical protein F4X02_08100 [Chloroflexi bacterium]|nr:hypothetical protein [Chloroflexota bacterium]